MKEKQVSDFTLIYKKISEIIWGKKQGKIEKKKIGGTMFDEKTLEMELAGRTLKVSTGKIARQSCGARSEEHTSELQSRQYLVCRLLLEKKKRRKRLLGP